MSKSTEYKTPSGLSESGAAPLQEPPGDDGRARRPEHSLPLLVYQLTMLSGRIDQVRAKCAQRLGISGPQYNVLQYVAQNQGDRGITVSKVAEGLLVTGAYVTKEVNQLISGNLVVKSPNPDDGRSVLLKLSDHGARILAELAPTVENINHQMFASLDRDRFAAFSGTIHEILKDAEKTARKVALYLDD